VEPHIFTQESLFSILNKLTEDGNSREETMKFLCHKYVKTSYFAK